MYDHVHHLSLASWHANWRWTQSLAEADGNVKQFEEDTVISENFLKCYKLSNYLKKLSRFNRKWKQSQVAALAERCSFINEWLLFYFIILFNYYYIIFFLLCFSALALLLSMFCIEILQRQNVSFMFIHCWVFLSLSLCLCSWTRTNSLLFTGCMCITKTSALHR